MITPDYGTVGVTCTIESADVSLPGKHTAQLSLAIYTPWSREITVMADTEQKLVAALKRG